MGKHLKMDNYLEGLLHHQFHQLQMYMAYKLLLHRLLMQKMDYYIQLNSRLRHLNLNLRLIRRLRHYILLQNG
jgi:hypothetical protein